MKRARRLAGIVLAAFALFRCAAGDPGERFGEGAGDAAPEAGRLAEGGRIDDADQDAPECTRRVVINELSVGGGTAGEEFVELFNAGTCAASIGGFRLLYRSAADVPGTTPLVVFDPGQGIVAGGYLLVATATFGDGGAGDYVMTAGLAAGGGQLALVDENGAVVDGVGYGTAAGAYVENTSAPAPPSNSSIARTPSGKDTGNNAADFTLESTPSAGIANP